MLHVKFQSEPRRQECRKSMRCACSVAEHNVETGEFLLLIYLFIFFCSTEKVRNLMPIWADTVQQVGKNDFTLF